MVQTFVAIWIAAWAIKVLGWIIPMPVKLLAGLQLGTMVIVGVTSWRGSRELAPWTPKDIRDGALGYGFVAMLIVPLIAGAAASLVAPSLAIPGAIVAAAAVIGAAAWIHRRAERLGVEQDPDLQPTDEFPAVGERGYAR